MHYSNTSKSLNQVLHGQSRCSCSEEYLCHIPYSRRSRGHGSMAPLTQRQQRLVFICLADLFPFSSYEANSRLQRLFAENTPGPVFCHHATYIGKQTSPILSSSRKTHHIFALALGTWLRFRIRHIMSFWAFHLMFETVTTLGCAAVALAFTFLWPMMLRCGLA